ncbi:adenine deaminase C-terminal domain-containing protein [Xylophilus sp. ASV27]|uniref:adenine deaminase C-terminal domain-containing protein n=1 Tax=Xylophilus sp. ASV27 TaxID=2795129 RepID=UPI0018EA7F53|nr:adenine deaminase C-terminal domain-containing protein [Xylophilus sp. ASV27]
MNFIPTPAVPLLLAMLLGASSTWAVGKPPSIEALKAEYKKTFDIIGGKAPADLLIKNVQILDVYTNSVEPGSLLIQGEKIIAVNPSQAISARKVFDGKGMIAIPGLIDAHFHVESQWVTPAAMQKLLVPHGTTSIYAEIPDLVSAAKSQGVEAAKAVFLDYEKFPYRMFVLAPGKKVDLPAVRTLLDWEPVIGLGELNHNLLLAGQDAEFEKLAIAASRGMIVDGHVEFTKSANQVNLFPALGTTNNHNVITYAETVTSLRMGLPTVVRDMLGSLEAIIPGVVSHKLPTDNLLLGTDNISVSTLVQNGHMDNIVQKVIGMGVSPIDAIKMASYNVARSFKMEDKLGSLTPGRYADILLIPRIDQIKPAYVFKGGELVAENGQLMPGKEIKVDYSAVIATARPGLDDLKKEDLVLRPLELSADGSKAKVMLWNQSFADKEVFTEQWLDVKDGKVVPEFNGMNLARISVVERYAKNGKRNILNAYITGYTITKGAVGMNFSSPSQHIGVIGATVDDIYSGIKALDKYTGAFLTAEGGKIKTVLDLSIFGMMTNLQAEDIVQAQTALANDGVAQGYTSKVGMPWYRRMSYMFFSLDRHRKIH